MRLKKQRRLKAFADHIFSLKNNRRTEKGLWFRFFNNDTGATLIRNIEHWLDCPTNRESIREDFKITIDNPKGLQIYYS